MLIPWYLLAAYVYYELDDPILTDGFFDQLCRQLEFCWDMVEHRHKSLVRQEDLPAGTCLADFNTFPLLIRDTATRLVRQ